MGRSESAKRENAVSGDGVAGRNLPVAVLTGLHGAFALAFGF